MIQNVSVQTRDCEVDAPLRAHFESKLQSLDKLWPRLDEAEVRLRCERGHTIAEIMLYAEGGFMTRAEERAPELRQAFDAALHKLQTQLRRYKEKMQNRSRRQNNREPDGTVLHPIIATDVETPTISALTQNGNGNRSGNGEHELDRDGLAANGVAGDELADGDEAPATLVRVKRFALKPMSPDEAALQMDLLGHDFFVFRNSRDHEVGVVYRRSSGGYGLIEPVND